MQISGDRKVKDLTQILGLRRDFGQAGWQRLPRHVLVRNAICIHEDDTFVCCN
jgi:hypothetical protein